ncbi:MAG TPA: UDP-3-O-(3-hydroxymyristoyl)glucosamine N-acyltransferase [Acidobacteriota bacterium]|nr:UDP-3-O-(3-hydroxymyristoyl)glucosamine N-acyltransferase [Acidobacteriota bacterium]
MRLAQISELLGCKLEGDPNLEILGVDRIETATPRMLTFLASRKYASKLKETQAGAVIVDFKVEGNGRNLLRHENPYLTYARALELFYKPYRPSPSISPDAHIAASARIGKGVYIGPYVFVDEEVQIGDGCILFPNVTVYRGARIGANCVLHSNVSVRELVQVGNNVLFKNGAVVGSEGFGFAKLEDGSHYKIIQTGQIVIEDDVEIGANTTIDRPAIGETRVRRGAKIDNLVQIGHASDIGENSILCAQVGLAGSTTIGKKVILSGQVGVAGHLEIGDNVIATAQTGIPSSVKENQFVSGYPAIDNRTCLKASAVFTRLPELLRELQALQARVDELEKQKK